jgi:chlorobactene glucosyltransferase
MYRNLAEIMEGFGKNIFAFFDYRILPYVFVWMAVIICFLEPILAIISRPLGGNISARLFNYAVIAVLETIALFIVGYHALRIPLYLIPFYPLTIFLFVLVAIRSMVLTLTGRASWKGRELKKVGVKWL